MLLREWSGHYIITLCSMLSEAQRGYLLLHFQQYRIIQPTVIFLHGLPTALSHKQTLSVELQRIGPLLRINIQSAGKDFFTAFVEFQREVAAATAIASLDGRQIMNRTLRVFYGSTKFCPHYLKAHECRLQECNYAHYYHPALTHLKEQAKIIDHRAIAHMVLANDPVATQQTIHSITQGREGKERLMLPFGVDSVIGPLGISMDGGGIQVKNHTPEDEYAKEEETKGEEETKQQTAIAPQEEWCAISHQIQHELHVPGQSPEKVRRSRIQDFLDGAQRFLSRLIFQSSDFLL